MQNENLSIEQIYKNLLAVWFALFTSQFIFLLVIYFVKPEIYKFDFSKPLLGENAPIIIAFAFIAFTTLIISTVLRKTYLNKAYEQQNVGLVQTAMIIGCALCESISLFGFVLAFAFGYQYFFLWFIIGILGMIPHFPNRETLHLASYKKNQKL